MSNNLLIELSDNTGLEKFHCNDNILDNLDISPLSDLVVQCCNQGFYSILLKNKKQFTRKKIIGNAILNAVSNDLTNSKLKDG